LIYISGLNLVERSFYQGLTNTSLLREVDYDFNDRALCEGTGSLTSYIGSCSQGFFLPQDEISDDIISCIECNDTYVTQSGSISQVWWEIIGNIRSIPGYFSPNETNAIGETYEFEGVIDWNTFFSSGSIVSGWRDGIIQSILLDLCGNSNSCDEPTGLNNLLLERDNDELFIYQKNLTPELEQLYFRFTSITSNEANSTETQYLKKD